MMSTSRDIMSTSGRYYDLLWGYHENIGGGGEGVQLLRKPCFCKVTRHFYAKGAM